MGVTLSDIVLESTHLSGNPIWVKGTTSGIPSGATNYKILLKVVSPDGVLEGGPFIDPIAPDANNEALFNISGLVDQAVDKDFTWPLSGRVKAHPDMAYDVWLYMGERYYDSNGDLQESFNALWGGIFIVKGKLPKIKLAEYNDAGEDWFSVFATGGKFLTWLPTTQTVSPYQPVKLWYRCPVTSGSITITLTCTGTFSDGSTQTITQSTTVSRASLHEFDLQPENMGFVLDNGTKKLIKYTFTATDFETRTYLIDWEYYDKYWYLFVDNQIGGIDCIWLRGEVIYSPTGVRTISGKPLVKGAGVKIPTLKVSGNSRQRGWQINSGGKSREEIAALDILLDSPNAWLAIPPAASGSYALSGYSIAPVIITDTEFELSNTLNDIDSVDITLIEAH